MEPISILHVPDDEPAAAERPQVRLLVRAFVALAVLLSITISTTAVSLLYNSATALREEAETSAIDLVEMLANSFAEMGEISLANIARTLDATLDGQMTAQARITAHLVAAAEAAGQRPAEIIETLDAVVADTVLDEFWITDETGFSYLTNVRGPDGELVPFKFEQDPAVQPQASKFYVLLDSAASADDVITQPAQVREIDQQVYKYVGVNGVDRSRIVQVGNALVFGEQEILTNVYTSQRADVSAVIEGILSQHMTVHATLVDALIAAGEDAGWNAAEIERRLRRITRSTAIGEIQVANRYGQTLYSTAGDGSNGSDRLAHYATLEPLLDSAERRVMDHPTAPHRGGGLYKFVTIAGEGSPHAVQIGIPIETSAGNLLYSVYQREADVLIRARNLNALWLVDLDHELTAYAPRATEADDFAATAARAYGRQARALVDDALEGGGVVSASRLSFLDRRRRGLWVATPIVNTGGIPIGALALSVDLDGIVDTVYAEAGNTTLIALLLLGFTAAAAWWGTRWVTHPIEIVATAARAVEAGDEPALDALHPVLERTDEIGNLARAFDTMAMQVFSREEQLETLVAERTAALEKTNATLADANHSLQRAHTALDKDLTMAKAVQAALVRTGNAGFGQLRVHARMTPAQQVGGDFVDLIELGQNKLLVIVCDVSGKGVAAALFMAASQGAITSAAAPGKSVTSIIAAANRRLCAENPMELFVTGILAVIDTRKGTMDYVSAGHEAPVVVGADGTCVTLPLTDSLPMGLARADYPPKRHTLQPGDTLFLYTDGLTDAIDNDRRLFGKDRLMDALEGAPKRAPEAIVDHIWDRIRTFSAGAPAADDMTCLVLRRTGGGTKPHATA